MIFSRVGLLFVACALVGCGDTAPKPKPLAKTATLELHVVSPTETADTIEAAGETGPLFLVNPPILAAADIESVQLSSVQPDFPSLLVNTTPAGNQKLSAATANLRGTQLALVANGVVVGSAKLVGPLTASFEISSNTIVENGESLVESLTR